MLLQNVLKTARRMSDSVSGEVGTATQKIHPPGAIISMQLTEESLPPSPEQPATMNHYITCIPSDSFGVQNATEFWCKDFERGGNMAGDGTLNTFMMELTGSEWERSIQVRTPLFSFLHFKLNNVQNFCIELQTRMFEGVNTKESVCFYLGTRTSLYLWIFCNHTHAEGLIPWLDQPPENPVSFTLFRTTLLRKRVLADIPNEQTTTTMATFGQRASCCSPSAVKELPSAPRVL